LMPAALMIGHHFSMSAFCAAASASGVCSSRGEFPIRSVYLTSQRIIQTVS